MVKNVYVYAGWLNDELIGTIHVLRDNGREAISFEYSDSWLKFHSNILLYPSLLSFAGRQYPYAEKSMFGMLSDVCPDRWGRRLIQRKEELLAVREKRKPRYLHEMDYLMSVSDFLRTGGLRFKVSQGGDFIAVSDGLEIPPVAELGRLERASLHYEFSGNSYETKWFLQLISPGSSLGGARPKANVSQSDGSLWIAKFPSRDDDIDIGAWEYVVHELAVLCGLRVPEASLQKFSSYGSTFTVKRFDRKDQRRIHFASAMTMLDALDGKSDQYSYLDIAEFISSYSKKPLKDLEELFRRIAFSIAVSNHDDHLRNHGFLLREHGWELSPAYDINPSLDNSEFLSMKITLDSQLASYEVLSSTSEFYHLTGTKANEIISTVRDIVRSNWKLLAKRSGIDKSEIRSMSMCFER